MGYGGKEWQKWGKLNPYFGVLSHPEFEIASLTENNRVAFFASGEAHVDAVFDSIRKTRAFEPERALDYGCGVGRLVRPLSTRIESVTGIDISQDMLLEAKLNCPGCRLLHTSTPEDLDGCFDFIHSYIVFQHIPVHEGERIFEKLVCLLANDGIAASHLSFEDTRPILRQWVSYLRSHFRIANSFANFISGNHHPPIQMNCYSMNRI